MRYGWIFFHYSVANMMVIAVLEMMVKVKVMVALVVNAMMVMVALIRAMVMVVLIRAGSEAMIGYSPAVLATDRGTEEQPAALKGALIALRHIKILTILTPTLF